VGISADRRLYWSTEIHYWICLEGWRYLRKPRLMRCKRFGKVFQSHEFLCLTVYIAAIKAEGWYTFFWGGESIRLSLSYETEGWYTKRRHVSSLCTYCISTRGYAQTIFFLSLYAFSPKGALGYEAEPKLFALCKWFLMRGVRTFLPPSCTN